MVALIRVSDLSAQSLRAAAARVSRAAHGFLQGAQDGELPLGDVRLEELRSAALRLLAVLDAGGPHAAALAGEQVDRAGQVVRVLQALELRELSAEDRSAVAEAVACAHAELRAGDDDEVTRALLDATPAGALLADLVFAVDPSTLEPDAQVSYCQAAQRLESATHARLGAGLVAFAGSNPRQTQYWVDGDEYALTDVRTSELASALAWSGGKARTAVEAARLLHTDLELAADAAATGALQPAALTVIAEGAQLLTAGIDEAMTEAREALRLATDSGGDISDRLWELSTAREEMVQRYDSLVSDYASGHTVAETRRKVRDTLARLDPEGFEARRARAKEQQSSVVLRPLPDAMSMLTAVMPAEQAAVCYQAIDAAARDEHRTDPELPIGVRRSDALFAFCATSAVGGGQGETARASAASTATAHVDLVMTLDAFLGLSETPAECVGAGPIPAQAARELLADAALVTFRRLLVDARTGHALDVGVQRYQLTAGERDYIFARDRTCRRPGCTMPAHRCECDHAIPYDEGGGTESGNLGALCLRHHQEKTHGGWEIAASAADGSCTFVSPLGRRYPHAPTAVLPWAVPVDPPPDTGGAVPF